MFKQFLSVIHAHLDELSDRKLYLACSGGRDSMVLAWLCRTLHEQGVLASLPTLLHVHHGWQKANDDWADLVSDWARLHGFDCQILRVNLAKNSETVARESRYAALMDAMNDDGVLMLAHHANDQAETLLMRLINGTGVQGLAAMRMWQDKHAQGKTVRLFRPMLGISRDEISQFANQQCLPYVDDPTNHDDAHLRGKLRNHIMPQLHAINPKAVQNIARASQLLAESADIIDGFISQNLAQVYNQQHLQCPFCTVLDIDKVLALPKSVQSSLVHAWLSESEPLPPNHRLTEQVLTLMARQDGDHQTRLFWQGEHGYMICRYRGQVYRYRDDAWAVLMANLPTDLANHQMMNDGKIIFKKINDLAIVWQVPDEFSRRQLSVQKVNHQTCVPFAHRTLHGKKLMQRLGVPAWLRENLWLILGDGEPVVLVGVAVAWRLSDNGVLAGARFWQTD